MDVNEVNERSNTLIKDFQNEDLEGLFNDLDYLLEVDSELIPEDEKVRIFSDALRMLLLKTEVSLTFINNVLLKLEDYPQLKEYDCFKISETILKLHTDKLGKIEAINGLFDIINGTANQQDKINALVYIGNFILISGDEEINAKYFEQLETLKNGNELVEEMNFDKLTHRYTHDDYESSIKILEVKLQYALQSGDPVEIDSVISEIIKSTKLLQNEEAIYDPQELSLYALAKLKKNTGYIDLTQYFMDLYNGTDTFKGYVLDSYYDYLGVNYPYKIETDFVGIFNAYWENHYENDSEESKKAFLYMAADFLSGFYNLDVKLEEILSELERVD